MQKNVQKVSGTIAVLSHLKESMHPPSVFPCGAIVRTLTCINPYIWLSPNPSDAEIGRPTDFTLPPAPDGTGAPT